MKHRRLTLRLLVAILVIASLAPPGALAFSASPPPPQQEPAALRTLRKLTAGNLRVSYHPGTGKVSFIGADPDKPVRGYAALSPAASPEQAARSFLGVYGSLLGIGDQASELRTEGVKLDERGRSFVRFQQVYKGVPVLAGELIVSLDAGRNLISAGGEALPDPAVSVSPTLSSDEALVTAALSVSKKYRIGLGQLKSTEPELWIYNPVLLTPGGGTTRLVWRMEIQPKQLAPIRELVLVDADRGGVVLSFNQVDTARNRTTYNAGNGTTLPGTLVCSEANPTCSTGDAQAAAAHIYAGDTYDFYLSHYGRDSIDNAGMTIVSSVHYSSGYDNAFWNGTQMVYGDAHGFALADDVVAHELTHGVTQHESQLFYYYQSGAINESFSDLWGEFVDQTNGKGTDTAAVKWLIGEDIAGLGAIRSMQDPTAFGDPDKMSSSYYDLGMTDNGGVHTNSGINNKAVYLMTDGGSSNGHSVTGLGIDKVAQLYYKVQTELLTSGADYAALADALQEACSLLVGAGGFTTSDCPEVSSAIDAVEMRGQPAPGFNPEAEVCPAGLVPHGIFSDGFESGTGNWTFGASAGTDRWQLDSPYGPYAHSGSHSLYADDDPAAITDTYAAMNTSVLLPAGAYLWFAHAYAFEPPNYDGGVVEYSPDAGKTWFDAGSLIDQNGYVGPIDSGFGNPLGARSAFLGDSHGYISTRLNLASLAGQSLRFRWRAGLDGSIYNEGWWLDDVMIYSCQAPATQYQYLPLVLGNYPSGSPPVPTPTPTSLPSWTTIISTDFEGTFPGPWQVAGASGYSWGKRNCRAYAGSSGGWAVGAGADGGSLACGSNYPDNADSWMVYGPFSLVGTTAADLHYKLWLESELGYDGICRFASTDGTNFYGECLSGDSGGWIDQVLDLSNVYSIGSLLGQSNVWVAIEFSSDYLANYPEGAYVDNVVVRKCSFSSCPVLAAVQAAPQGIREVEANKVLTR